MANFSIDEYKPLKVVVIGAGISGIYAGIRLRQKIQNLDLTIYEQQEEVGGTWWANRYPGLSCDMPAPCYQYSFDQKPDWSAFYAPGPEILGYLQGVVEKYKLRPYIKLRHELKAARYDEATGQWHLTIKRASAEKPGEFEEFQDTADFFFTGVGILSRLRWPDIEGLNDFKGIKVHPADWNLGGETWQDDVKDWGDKKIGVIGLGSSGLQIVSALASRVGHLTQFARGRTWIGVPLAKDTYSQMLGREVAESDLTFTEEEKKGFEDREKAREFRAALEQDMNSAHMLTLRGYPFQQMAQEGLTAYLKGNLASKPGLAEKILPDFGVTCRRLTPAPGYLQALCRDNVQYETTGIKRITGRGIELVDGQFVELDVLICATGYDTSLNYPFSVIGRNGVSIHDKWSPDPASYLSVCIDGFPNWFFSCGPNAAVGTGSLMMVIEKQIDYAIMAAEKMQRDHLKSIEVKPQAVQDFSKYAESYFPKTYFTDKAASWYKNNKADGKVICVWPGSTLHAIRVLKHPRWEDFTYENAESSSNSLYFLGDGMTANEKEANGDRTWYLRDGWLDIPPVPEN